MQGRSPQVNLPEGNSILPAMGLRRRVSLRSPVRKNCTPGSVRGASGNRRPYRDDVIRRPALLRQIFAVAMSLPAQIVSLQKLQGQLQDHGALETVAHYLALLEEAYLVAPIAKYAENLIRRRSAPPKLVTLNNALVAAVHGGEPTPEEWGGWVENACL